MKDKNGSPDLVELLRFVPILARNPIEGIRQIPDLSWPTLLLLGGGTSALSGVLAGLVSGRWEQILGGLIVLPTNYYLLTFFLAGFFYYTGLFFFRVEIPFRPLYSLILTSSLPFLIIHPISSWAPPFSLLGMALTCLLLIVGLVDTYRFPRKSTIRLVTGLFLTFVIIWIINMLAPEKKIKKIEEITTPESLEIIEKELNQ